MCKNPETTPGLGRFKTHPLNNIYIYNEMVVDLWGPVFGQKGRLSDIRLVEAMQRCRDLQVCNVKSTTSSLTAARSIIEGFFNMKCSRQRP